MERFSPEQGTSTMLLGTWQEEFAESCPQFNSSSLLIHLSKLNGDGRKNVWIPPSKYHDTSSWTVLHDFPVFMLPFV